MTLTHTYLSQATSREAVIARLALCALHEHDLEALLDQIAHQVQQSLDADFFGILELQPDGEQMLLRSGAGWPEEVIGTIVVGAGPESLAGHTLGAGGPVLIDDLPAETRFSQLAPLLESGVVSSAACAIRDEGGVYGVIGVHARRPSAFTEDDGHFLEAIGAVVAGAISRHFAQVRLGLERAVAQAVTDSEGLEPLVRRVHASFTDLLGTCVGELWWRGDDEDILRCRLVSTDGSVDQKTVERQFSTGTFRRGQGLIGRVFQQGRPEWLWPLGTPSLFMRVQQAAELGLRTGIALPVPVGDEVCGVISVFAAKPLVINTTFINSLQSTGRAIGEFVRRQRAEEQLREANAQKDEFIAMLGHELRNPLAAMRTATDSLMLIDAQNPQLERIEGILDRQTSHMATLLDSLLDVSRIERGKITVDRRPLDLVEVVEHVLQDRHQQIDQSKLAFHIELSDTPLQVSGDRVRLTQVVDNLLTNAIKYTESPGTVELSLRTAGDEAVFEIRDTGIGITPELLPHVFESFRQASQDLARSTGGLGLGLAMVKGLVELHGGHVSASSDGIDQGATFTLRLPLDHSAGPTG